MRGRLAPPSDTTAWALCALRPWVLGPISGGGEALADNERAGPRTGAASVEAACCTADMVGGVVGFDFDTDTDTDMGVA